MFRFSIDADTPIDATPSQLAAQHITEDDDFAARLHGAGEFEEGERYFRAENVTPTSVVEAVSYVQGILFHPPARVWLDGALHEVTDEHVGAARKPTT